MARQRMVALFASAVLFAVSGSVSRPADTAAAIASGQIVYTGADGLPWAAKLDGTMAHRLVPPVPGETWGPPAWSANGNLIVAVRKSTSDPANTGRILVMDPIGAVVASYAVPLAYTSCSGVDPVACVAAFNPDATKLVYGAGNGLRILTRSTGATSLVPNTSAGADWPSWSPGGAYIAYTDSIQGLAVVINPNGTGKRTLRTDDSYPCGLFNADSCYDFWGPAEWTPAGTVLLPYFHGRCDIEGCYPGNYFLEVFDPATGDILTNTYWIYLDNSSRVALTPNSKTLVVRGSENSLTSLAKTAYPPAPPPGEEQVKPQPLSVDGNAPDVSRAPTRAPLTPNDSLLLYKAGQAITGTLVNGVWTQKAAFSTTGWTAAAASRDSLALYNRTTGALRTGTFRNGVFTVKSNTTIAKGYTRVAGTCDSALFYNGASGKSFAATLRGGFLGSTRRTYTFAAGAPRLLSTCDTLQLDYGNASTRIGLLSAGRFTAQAASGVVPTGALLAGTADSYIRVASTGGGQGEWGTLYAGDATQSASASSFGAWTTVAGTATSLYFYNSSSGATALVSLKAGTYQGGGAAASLGSGFTLIVGGR